jgi:peptidoglycan-associated lipoprotein
MPSLPRLALALACASLFAACSSTPVDQPTTSTTATTSGSAPAAAGSTAPSGSSGTTAATPSAGSQASASGTALPAHLDPNSVISRDRLVFFDFDSDVLDAVDRALVETHARYLTGASSLSIRIEGHADERGSAEYNLALGQRRADSVRRAMSLLGVSAGRIETTSWGEERPLEAGHDESAWSRNRRAELVYPR